MTEKNLFVMNFIQGKGQWNKNRKTLCKGNLFPPFCMSEFWPYFWNAECKYISNTYMKVKKDLHTYIYMFIKFWQILRKRRAISKTVVSCNVLLLAGNFGCTLCKPDLIFTWHLWIKTLSEMIAISNKCTLDISSTSL